MKSITIAVVDDHPLFREGVGRSLSEVPDFAVVGEGATRDDALRLVDELVPDVLLLDISLPGGGLQAIEPVLDNHPGTRIVILTASEDLETLQQALREGAFGYVLKGVGSRGLAEAIRSVASGQRYVVPTMSAKLLAERTDTKECRATDSLTPREREVLDLVEQGLGNKHIALRLDLQEKTVKHHMTQILTKLGVSNRTEAALLWHDLSANERMPAGDGRRRLLPVD